MEKVNVGPSRLAREAGSRPSTIADLRSGRIQSPGYQLVRGVFDALRRLGLDESITLDDVFPVARGSQLPLPVERRISADRRTAAAPMSSEETGEAVAQGARR